VYQELLKTKKQIEADKAQIENFIKELKKMKHYKKLGRRYSLFLLDFIFLFFDFIIGELN